MSEEKKLKIGIDLDDVVFEFVKPFLEIANEKYDKSFSFEDVLTYDFLSLFDISIDSFGEAMNDFEKRFFMDEKIFIQESKDALFNLEKNHELFFITSRVYFKDRTLEQLKKYFADLNFELVFSSNPYAETKGKTKDEICNDLGIDFMIEDDRKHSKNCAEKGVKCFLIGKPWNQDCEHENIIRVKDWNEILERLKNEK